MKPTYAPCLNHPDRLGVRRGLCDSCYQTLIKRISKGELTDKQAVRKGLMLKPTKAGRKREVQPFPRSVR